MRPRQSRPRKLLKFIDSLEPEAAPRIREVIDAVEPQVAAKIRAFIASVEPEVAAGLRLKGIRRAAYAAGGLALLTAASVGISSLRDRLEP